MLSQLLEGVGANVTVADNAQDALKAIASGAGGFDALVSDLAMPNHDGYDLIREICRRGHDAKPSLQLRSLGSRTATMQRRAILAGFQKHISKPVDVHHLTAILARFVGRTAQVVRSDAFREHRLPEARALGPNIPSGRALTCPAQAGPCVHSASY